MSTQPFIFGGNTGHSYEDIKRLRERADSLQPTGGVVTGVAGFGHGLSTLGRALAARHATKKADELEQQGRQSFRNSFDSWKANQNNPETSGQDMIGGMDAQAFELAYSPYASQGQKALMQLMLQKKYQDKDPMKEIQLKKAQLELEQMQAPQSGVDFETEQKLRKEFSGLPTAKSFSTINDSWDRIQASAQEPSAAGDLALVFNYMKMLDPGSTVREGEFATAANAGGVDQRILGMYNRVVNGERLTEDQRKDFVGRAGQLFNAQAGNYNDTVGQYRGLAEQYSLSPDRIAQAVELYKAAQEQAPQEQTPQPDVDPELENLINNYVGGE